MKGDAISRYRILEKHGGGRIRKIYKAHLESALFRWLGMTALPDALQKSAHTSANDKMPMEQPDNYKP